MRARNKQLVLMLLILAALVVVQINQSYPHRATLVIVGMALVMLAMGVVKWIV
jgi:uncharacterized membrane protein YccC